VHTALLSAALLSLIACGSGSGSEDGPDGGAAGPGEPEIWLQPDGPAADLACDATYLYYGDTSGLHRVSLAGGEPETLYALECPGESYLCGVAAIYVGPSHVAAVWISMELVEPFASERHLVVVPKQGGSALTLASSADVRSFLGAQFHADYLYYSSFTSVLRVPISGGDVDFVAESPGPVSYWIYSPVVVGDALFWAEDAQIYRMQLDDPEKEGEALASLPGVGKIVDYDETRFVVALSPAMAFQEPANAFAIVDTTTGAVATAVELGGSGADFAVAGADVWVASWQDGLLRYPLAGGPSEAVLDGHMSAVATTTDAVFAATESDIWRIPR